MKKYQTLLLAMLGLPAFFLAASPVSATDFTPLIGRWQRTDGGYIIEIRSIAPDGKMAAGYFNPNPINVSRAQVSIYKDYLKVEVELRDKGYPGSAYTLVYDQLKDRLIGLYYHAVSRQNFDVVFVRQR
jgi:hypothetical protein